MVDKFLYVEDVMKITGYKEAKCRNIIKSLNDELKEKGYLIFPGRVSEKYFQERCFPNKKALEEAGTSTSAN